MQLAIWDMKVLTELDVFQTNKLSCQPNSEDKKNSTNTVKKTWHT